MKKIVYTLSLIIILFFSSRANAQVILHDSAKVSLLTASYWHGAVYALFGHTAIHVQDDTAGVDAVFNYGFFDPSQPNFIYNFVRGKTDYVLGITTFEEFLNEYGYKGQQVTEQILNLSTIEKQLLYDALFINSLPENRGYRYNYFYDNCATRPRDMIEKYARSTIQYPATAKDQSYRDLVHECVEDYPWIKFGIDLLIGSEADRIIDVREKMFIPSYLMNSFEGAICQVNDSLKYPLVSSSEVILDLNYERNNPGNKFFFTPFVASIILLIITILVCLIQFAKFNKSILPKIYDTILFGVAGLAGTVIFILMYFSEHPATNPNWNFVWINIFALIAAILFWVKPAKNIVYFYHFINFVVLTLFLLSWWFIPQQLPVVTILFSLCLWGRSGTNLLMLRKKKLVNSRLTSSRYLKAGWGQ
ncbi:MAG: DUF4105 domain-containing protein [Fermentimonas sp.]|jgi:hypothetical protein|nr:DUF4105 domain-containing protein [Fermentimonas sp.]NLC86021.1 DUF4105 domain-containing protein [Bacteroidales bacterium]HBT86303.1 hypothetical protein [Porphyromonadaceae bacterium]MDD2930182.1 DUF4105 domain-containing protein [Fermentimonas sp.]MDD3188771.1 DUF4105 domain-containing protein [Fermentimonas sp.]